MSDRRVLPQRRPAETFELTFGNMNSVFTVTTGFYHDGSIGEVFITGAKAGTEMDAITRDGAIILSLALQHRVPLKTIQHAITRNADGKAATVVGAVIDRIAST